MSDIYCIIDCETTGLDVTKHCIIEIGAIITDMELNVLETYQTYVKPFPGAVVDQSAMDVNGITVEDLIDAPSETAAFNGLTKILRQPKYNSPTYVAFNQNFDLHFLKSLCFRNKLFMYGNGLILDLQMMVNDQEGIRKYSLKSAAEHFGIIRKDAHRALGDCWTNLELLKKVNKA